jgi:hypothetical protein
VAQPTGSSAVQGPTRGVNPVKASFVELRSRSTRRTAARDGCDPNVSASLARSWRLLRLEPVAGARLACHGQHRGQINAARELDDHGHVAAQRERSRALCRIDWDLPTATSGGSAVGGDQARERAEGLGLPPTVIGNRVAADDELACDEVSIGKMPAFQEI